MKTTIYNIEGKKAGDFALPEAVFARDWNGDLMHQYVVAVQANRRSATAHTKGRGDVRGGGKKPWKQKGTGRARHGSSRSPIWIGGGTTHGPNKEKDFTKKINNKVKAAALSMALSKKLDNNQMLLVDSLEAVAKTKDAKKALANLSSVKGFETLSTRRKNAVLVAVSEKNETERSLRNIPGVTVSEIRNLNAYDILNHRFIMAENPEQLVATLEAKFKSNK